MGKGDSKVIDVCCAVVVKLDRTCRLGVVNIGAIFEDGIARFVNVESTLFCEFNSLQSLKGVSSGARVCLASCVTCV